MSDDFKLTPLEGLHGLILHTADMTLADADREFMRQCGYVFVQVANMKSVDIRALPVRATIGAATIEAATLAALEAVMEASTNAGPRTLFGAKMAAALIEATRGK